MAHPPAISISISSLYTFNRAGGRTPNVATMNPEKEARLFNQGFFVVLAVVATLVALAYYIHAAFVWPIVVIVLGWIIFCSIKAKNENKRLAEAFDKVFGTFPGSMPELKKGNSYGYPSFGLHFETKAQMEQALASGHIGAFKASLKELFGHVGFDVDKGFGTTYEGWIADYMASRKLGAADATELNERVKTEDASADRQQFHNINPNVLP